jgi:hypothetical protein
VSGCVCESVDPAARQLNVVGAPIAADPVVWPGSVYASLSLLHKALAAKQIQVHGGDRIENDEHQAVLG